MMNAIICKNDTKILIQKLQEFVNQGGIIKGVYLADQNDTQIVVLVDEAPISEELAQIWWNGYAEGMKAIL